MKWYCQNVVFPSENQFLYMYHLEKQYTQTIAYQQIFESVLCELSTLQIIQIRK